MTDQIIVLPYFCLKVICGYIKGICQSKSKREKKLYKTHTFTIYNFINKIYFYDKFRKLLYNLQFWSL